MYQQTDATSRACGVRSGDPDSRLWAVLLVSRRSRPMWCTLQWQVRMPGNTAAARQRRVTHTTTEAAPTEAARLRRCYVTDMPEQGRRDTHAN